MVLAVGSWIMPLLVAAALVVIGWILLRFLFPRRRMPTFYHQGRCRRCGWRGTVSKYSRVCPSCGSRNMVLAGVDYPEVGQ